MLFSTFGILIRHFKHLSLSDNDFSVNILYVYKIIIIKSILVRHLNILLTSETLPSCQAWSKVKLNNYNIYLYFKVKECRIFDFNFQMQYLIY